MDHPGMLVRSFYKQVGVGLTIEVEILVLLECLKLAKIEGFSSLTIEGYSKLILFG